MSPCVKGSTQWIPQRMQTFANCEHLNKHLFVLFSTDPFQLNLAAFQECCNKMLPWVQFSLQRNMLCSSELFLWEVQKGRPFFIELLECQMSSKNDQDINYWVWICSEPFKAPFGCFQAAKHQHDSNFEPFFMFLNFFHQPLGNI